MTLNFPSILISILISFFLLSCGSNNESGKTANENQSGNLVAGTIANKPWTMVGGEAKFGKSLNITLFNSEKFIACGKNNNLDTEAIEVYISIPAKIGLYDIKTSGGGVFFWYFKDNIYNIQFASQGTVNITQINDQVVEGTVTASDLDGNTVSGSFSVTRCADQS